MIRKIDWDKVYSEPEEKKFDLHKYNLDPETEAYVDGLLRSQRNIDPDYLVFRALFEEKDKKYKEPSLRKSSRKTAEQRLAEKELEEYERKPRIRKIGANVLSGTKKLGSLLFNTGATIVDYGTKPARALANLAGVPAGFEKLATLVMKNGAYGKSFAKTKDVDTDRFPQVLQAMQFTLNSYYPDQEDPNWHYTWFADHDADAAFAAVQEDELTQEINLVFSFRGTSDWTDTKTDLNASHAETMNSWGGYSLPIPVTAASGFAHRIQELGRNGLAEYVGKVIELAKQYPSSPNDVTGRGIIDPDVPDRAIEYILITGHSLGGAVASIFAAILGQLLPKTAARKICLITFEPARALRKSTINELETKNPTMKTIFNNAIFTTTPNDPVPLLPLGHDGEHLASGFSHVGRNWMLPSDTVDAGFLAAHSSEKIAESLRKTNQMGIPNTRIYETNGKGRLKGKVKRKNKKTTMAMKARMAYVRSFRKK